MMCDGEAPRELTMTEGVHQVHVASGLDSLTCKAEEWTNVRVEGGQCRV